MRFRLASTPSIAGVWGVMALLGVLAVLLGAALGGCLQANTLGGDAPDAVTIAGTPTWNNGVGQLMALKCAPCHQQPRPATAPRNIPTDIDARMQAAAGAVRGGEDLAPYIAAGVLRHNVLYISRMPLPFATPVVESEAQALEAWAAAMQPPAVSGTTAADGAVLYAYACQGCHGINGAGAVYTNIQGGGFAGDGSTICGPLNGTIVQAICTVPIMQTWPGLSALTNAQITALYNFLAQFP